MNNIFSDKNLDDYIVMLAVKNKNEKSVIVKLPLNEPKVIEVTHKELQNLSLPGMCKIGPSTYFIYGGRDYNSKKLLNKCYVYNAKKDTLIRTKNMITPLNDQFSIRRKNEILAVAGRNQEGKITQEFWSFNLLTLEWTKLPNIFMPVKGIKKIFLDYEDNLVLISFPNEFLKYDFKQQKWSVVKEFYYEYNRVYISKSNDCYIFNAYHNTFYKYDYYNDEICTIKLLDDFQISDTFYFEELDVIFFVDNDTNKLFLTFDCQTEELRSFGKVEYDWLFGEFQCFRSFDNPKLLRKDKVVSKKVGDFMKNKYVIFGNYHSPFQMIIDYDQTTVKLYSVPTDLYLKNEQGVLSFYDSKVLFTAGYRDDVSYHQTVATQLYDIETKEIQNMQDLTFQIGDNYLSRLDLVDKQYILCIAIDEIQVMDSEKQEWYELPCLDSKGILPCKLDEIDQFTVFFCHSGANDKHIMEIWNFDFVENQWKNLYENEIETKITLKFCKKISKDQYLVIQTSKQTEYFCLMDLLRDEDGKITEVQFERQDKICENNIKSYILDYGLFKDRFMYFIYVKGDFTIDFICYDLQKKKVYTDEKIENLNKQVLKLFQQMRYERYLWTFNTFGMLTRYVQLN